MTENVTQWLGTVCWVLRATVEMRIKLSPGPSLLREVVPVDTLSELSTERRTAKARAS